MCDLASCYSIWLQVVFNSAERSFTQFLIDMVVNKCSAEFKAACQLLLVRILEDLKATIGMCVVGSFPTCKGLDGRSGV